MLVLLKFYACILEVRKVLTEKSEIAFGKPQVFTEVLQLVIVYLEHKMFSTSAYGGV